MNPNSKKRQVDFQVIAQWVNDGDRVLDLGCGKGILLEYLQQKKAIYGVGVDIDFDKILSCVKRRVPAYHGDVGKLLSHFEDDSFDRVIFSRSVELLDDPDAILTDALRVGKRVTVGFVNHGYWKNRISFLKDGGRGINDVYPRPWYETLRANHFSASEFESYCESRSFKIENRVYLRGNWRDECTTFPNLLAGYAIYDLAK
ncbi:MAG TPA: methionine biosynthesis protein MetW [Opitutae bacterium]|nr:methionine biosynthesis protein MetW [Opitutae bacterium]